MEKMIMIITGAVTMFLSTIGFIMGYDYLMYGFINEVLSESLYQFMRYGLVVICWSISVTIWFGYIGFIKQSKGVSQ